MGHAYHTQSSQNREETTMSHAPLSARRPLPRLMLSMSSLAFLAACGGGGDSAVDYTRYLPGFAAPTPVAGTVLSVGFGGITGGTAAAAVGLLRSTQYTNTQATIQWLRGFPGLANVSGQLFALKSSGAAFAHAAGLTGDGQLIAISDEHLSPGHTVFAGKSVTIFSDTPLGDEHGTSVASVAAGNSPGFVGTAPDADILFGTYQTETDLAALGVRARVLGAVAWNNSWGYTDFYVTEPNALNVLRSLDNGAGQNYLNALDAYVNADGVVVFAVSNDESEVNSGIMDGLPYLRPSLEQGWITVVNGVPTFNGTNVASVDLISSPCWQAARWCMVADGTWNAATGSGNAFAFTTGSSFAAPQVSGALALLAEAFPSLTPQDLRIRLLASAEDDFFTPDATVELATGFFKGYSVIYGHGFLDIEAALRPIGTTTMSLADGGRISTDAPVLRTGTAFGDAVELSLADTNVAIKDQLNAGFMMPGQALTAGARPSSQAGILMAKSLMGDLAASRLADPSALAEPFANLLGPVMTLASWDGGSKASVLVSQDGAGPMGVTVSRALTEGATQIELGLKLARDAGGVMSLDGKDAANMASVTLGITQDLGGGGYLALSGEMGLTDLGGATALSGAGTASFDAVKLTAGTSDIFTLGDRLSIGVGMPVAIASGQTVLDLPVMRETMAAKFEDVTLDLAPEDRQIDLDLTYQTALAKGIEMKLSLIHSDNFGNRAGETDTAGALAFAFRF
jgi:subtilase-type serine protease